MILLNIRAISFVILFLCSSQIFSQAPEWQWVKRGGGVSTWSPPSSGPDDEVVAMETDKYGNTYVASRVFTAINASIDSAPLAPMRGGRDGVVAKFDCEGKLKWYLIVGGSSTDLINDIAVDSSGNVYITGAIYAGSMATDSAYIGAKAYRFLSSQSYLTKLDSNGQEIWTHIAYSTNTNSGILTASVGYSIGIDAAENIYLYGTSESKSAFFYPGIELNETYFIAKYNTLGVVLWAEKLIPFPSPLEIQNIDVSNDGHCFLVGTLMDTMVIGGTPYNVSNGNGESIVLEYDSSGDYVWGHISQSNTFSTGYAIRIDKNLAGSEEFAIVGNTTDGAKFGSLTFPILAMGSFGYVVKYKNHVPIWKHYVDAVAPTDISSIAIDKSNQVYVACEVIGNTSIGGMKVKGKGGDPFIAKFTGSGDTIYAKNLSTNASGFPRALAAGHNGNIWLGGSFSQNIRLPGDTVWNIGGNTDFFIAKFGIDQCTDTTTIDTTDVVEYIQDSKHNLKVYPNPNNGQFTIETGINEQGELQLFDISGSLVYRHRISGGLQTGITLPESIPGGVYILQFMSYKTIEVARITVIKR